MDEWRRGSDLLTGTLAFIPPDQPPASLQVCCSPMATPRTRAVLSPFSARRYSMGPMMKGGCGLTCVPKIIARARGDGGWHHLWAKRALPRAQLHRPFQPGIGRRTVIAHWDTGDGVVQSLVGIAQLSWKSPSPLTAHQDIATLEAGHATSVKPWQLWS